MKKILRLVAWLCVLAPAVVCAQERAADTRLTLRLEQQGLTGEWRLPLPALGVDLRLDANGDGEATWPEMEPRQADIERLLMANLHVVANGGATGLRIDRLFYGAQRGKPALLARLQFDAQPDISELSVDMGRFAGSVEVRWLDGAFQSQRVSASAGPLPFAKADAHRAGFPDFVWQGMWHIWIGFDHILFLLVLLLPAVFRRTERGGREVVPGFGTALSQVLLIVTCFTVAHSITLTCAAMGWIVLPSRLVESAIAASVLLAALTNLLPGAAGGRGAWVAFAFGLLHGFGFANALGELAPTAGRVWQSLLGFNLGVEIGQLAIVAVFLPVAFLLRRTSFYRVGALYAGSALAGAIALTWFVQRAFAL